MNQTRRNFLKTTASLAGSFAFSAAAVKAQENIPTQQQKSAVAQFPQGVASADPQSDAVLLWTRVEPAEQGSDVSVRVQMARDTNFDVLELDRAVSTGPDADYTLRVFVDELASDTTYYYRFLASDGSVSRVGRTWTAPDPSADRAASIAFASCQSLQTGFMGTYRHLVNLEKNEGLERSADLVMHLGDYIYENVPPQPTPLPLYLDGRSRTFAPFPSGGVQGPRQTRAALTKEDYRLLYKTYLSDPDLQEARARFPFVCIWDDHEFPDDSWQSFGLGRSTPRRRIEAYQAWFEFVPALLTQSRSPEGISNPARDFSSAEVEDRDMGPFDENFLSTERNNLAAMNSITVYRSIRWGKNVEILLTDLRSYRSPAAELTHSLESLRGETEDPELPGWGLPVAVQEILAAGKTYNNGMPPRTLEINGETIPNIRYNAPAVTNLGRPQKKFKSTLAASDAVWKIWGNPIPLMNFSIDYAVLGEGCSDSVMWPGDSWDAFPNERRELMQFVRDHQINNVVSFSGDRHLHAAGLVGASEDGKSEYVVPDFACSSIYMVTRVEIQSNEWRGVDERLSGVNTYRKVDASGTPVTYPNMNVAVRHGVAAAKEMARTHNWENAKPLARPDLNSHIDLFDGYSHGYGIGRFTGNSSSVTLYGFDVGSRSQHYGDMGSPESYRITYNLPVWHADDGPELTRVNFKGLPVFGDF